MLSDRLILTQNSTELTAHYKSEINKLEQELARKRLGLNILKEAQQDLVLARQKVGIGRQELAALRHHQENIHIPGCKAFIAEQITISEQLKTLFEEDRDFSTTLKNNPDFKQYFQSYLNLTQVLNKNFHADLTHLETLAELDSAKEKLESLVDNLQHLHQVETAKSNSNLIYCKQINAILRESKTALSFVAQLLDNRKRLKDTMTRLNSESSQIFNLEMQIQKLEIQGKSEEEQILAQIKSFKNLIEFYNAKNSLKETTEATEHEIDPPNSPSLSKKKQEPTLVTTQRKVLIAYEQALNSKNNFAYLDLACEQPKVKKKQPVF